MTREDLLFETLIRLADDHLILGHRVSEWCGHAPMLEEDLALPNIALDLIGQARLLYTRAGEIDQQKRDEDQLAYMRLEQDYHNLLLVARPNGDFGHTMLRQLYFSAFMELFWTECQTSSDTALAGIAAKAVKEAAYHVRHSAEWVIRLGDGTGESHSRMEQAITDLAPYTGELFVSDEVSTKAAAEGFVPANDALQSPWEAVIDRVFAEATLSRIDHPFKRKGGREGYHGEEMGHLLSELQYMQRTFPDMKW